MIFNISDHIEEDAEEVHHTACNDEKVKNRVHIAAFFAESVEYSADGIEDSADKQKRESSCTDCLIRCLGGENYDPADADVAHHREL